MTYSISDYTALVTTEHQKPKFLAVIGLLARSYIAVQAVCDQIMGSAFDVDTAVGNQLDTIGLWVGISRNVRVPITGKWFTWDGSASDGWESAPWWDENSSKTSISVLEDAQYRQVIKAKILLNKWTGDVEGLYGVLASFLPVNTFWIRDNVINGSAVGYGYSILVSVSLPAITRALLQQLPLQLAGVKYSIETY